MATSRPHLLVLLLLGAACRRVQGCDDDLACPEDQFTCANCECLPARYKCDGRGGYFGCRDGSDESPGRQFNNFYRPEYLTPNWPKLSQHNLKEGPKNQHVFLVDMLQT